jgi:hypothetical protein
VRFQIIYILLAMLAALSCTHDKAAPASPELVCHPPDTVSFSRDLQPIFNTYCNDAGCHSGGAPAAGLNLEASYAYAELLNHQTGYVDTVHPDYSVLYAEMVSATNPMPPTGNLNKCELGLVMKWIQQKAKNN